MSGKIALVVPYFGLLPEIFHVWLISCSFNKSVDWLIFTDDRGTYRWPQNVKVYYTTFEDMRGVFQEMLGPNINLDSPYRLCEFRPAFGEIYENYLKDYDFWGYCDTDLIWGNIRRFLTKQILNEYDKISWRGHFTLYKNTPEINRLYRESIFGEELSQYVFCNNSSKQFCFDENGINFIFEKHLKMIYKDIPFADLKIRSYSFKLLHYPKGLDYKNGRQIFYWNNGKLYRLYCFGEEVWCEEFMYIHFLKRNMSIELNNEEEFFIIPNKIISVDGRDDLKSYIMRASSKKIYWTYVLERVSINYVIKKVKYYKDINFSINTYPDICSKPFLYELPAVNDTKKVGSIDELRERSKS